MTERVPCKSEDCNRTILPTTALDTGGFCMPCVQKKANEEYKKYVEENKRTINPYDGVTKPIDIIKIYHKSQKRDPLIEYVKYPFPIETVYESLNHQQIHDLIVYCLDLLKNEDNNMAEEITSCLVSFLNSDISLILEWMVESDNFYPAYYFRFANEIIQSMLLEKIKRHITSDTDSFEKNRILCALSWIDSDEVNTFFLKNIQVQNYTYEAGWEIDQNGERRYLYHQQCYPLIKNKPLEKQEQHTFFETEKGKCEWCENPLTSLFSLNLDDPKLSFLKNSQNNLHICTCINCVWQVDNFFTKQIKQNNLHITYPNGDMSNHIKDVKEGNHYKMDMDTIPLNALVLQHKNRFPFHAVDFCLPTTLSQIGGHPTWIHETDYPSCPECKRTMIFEAQIAFEDFQELGEGIYYAFYCVSCQIAATSYQQT
jgi:hypothetical protein